MQAQTSRSVEFNQTLPVAAAQDVTLNWKTTSAPAVEFNAFWPEVVLGRLALKTPALYELLGNSLRAPMTAGDVTHMLKARGEWLQDGNVVPAGEMPDLAEVASVLTKTQS